MKRIYILSTLISFCFLISVGSTQAKTKKVPQTIVSISGKKFLINGKLTYKGRRWQGYSIEGFNDGYQSVPVNWGINSDRKKGFFDKLEEITGGMKNCRIELLFKSINYKI